jgi:hypothetical protein
VRIAYLDEAGMSSDEPQWIVAGVIIHGDSHYVALHDELDDIRQMLPEDIRDGFVFHAKELFNGGKTLKREDWPIERKLPIINRLLEIPAKFSLPIAWGCVPKNTYDAEISNGGVSDTDLMIAGYTTAFAQSAIGIEMWMRGNAANEIVQIVAEDIDRVKEPVKEFQALSRKKNAKEIFDADERYFPFRKIIDTPSYQKKTEASLLQIADMCAFTISRWVKKAPYGMQNFDKIRGQLITASQFPSSEAA